MIDLTQHKKHEAKPPLFDPPRARNTDPVTSHKAAVRAAGSASGHRAEIVDAMKALPGQAGTVEDIAGRCSLLKHEIGKRMHELRKAGVVEVVSECGRFRKYALVGAI